MCIVAHPSQMLKEANFIKIQGTNSLRILETTCTDNFSRKESDMEIKLHNVDMDAVISYKPERL